MRDFIPDWTQDQRTQEYLNHRDLDYVPVCSCSELTCESDCLCECHRHDFNNKEGIC